MIGASMATQARSLAQTLGWIAGPVAAAIVYVALPDSFSNATGATEVFSHAGRASAALGAWMAIWWLTEATDLAATALLPLAVLPLVGASTIRDAAAPYAHELIFLFMGGFLLSLSMQRWGLHRRIALSTLRIVGTSPARVVAGFMFTTALLSMWLSNTATVVMMLPIALSVIGLVFRPTEGQREALDDPDEPRRFAACLMLGTAYASSIGGIGTIIGSPPNLFLVSYVRDNLGREISFVRWMLVWTPLVAIFLPIAWYVLTRHVFPISTESRHGESAVRRLSDTLPPLNHGERVTLIVFALAIAGWVLRPVLIDLTLWGMSPFAGLTDPGIAMTAALCLFVVPSGDPQGGFVLDWEHTRDLPWGTLILFGGGLSLAAAIEQHGVGSFLGYQVSALAGLPSWLLVLLVSTLVVFLTELTSNTATAATLVPILAGVAIGLGVHPFVLIVPTAIGASWAFMLPAATPPNAIVFGSGHVTMAQMRRAGVWLNVVGIALLSAFSYGIALPLLGAMP